MRPTNVTFEQAASIPLAGLTALQGLRKANIHPGQKVLINGATGGVGTFAVQVAKSFGVEVTAVCSTRNVDIVRSIGAAHVIDYTKEDFTKSSQRYDVIFDNVCNHSFFERRRVLTAKGICILAGMGGAGVRGGQAIGRIAGNLFIARGIVIIHRSKVRPVHDQGEQKRSHYARRPHRGWKAQPGHRPNLQTKRRRGSSPLSQRRTRSRKSNN
jgi:NADPH:quinone reductase-like Zn-dependent oxidoreductase